MSNPANSAEPAREVLRPERDVVAANLPGLRARLKEMIVAGVQLLTLDLSNVQMVDSAGIGLLISAHNSLRKSGGSLELTHVAREIREMFVTMRMNRHFRISAED